VVPTDTAAKVDFLFHSDNKVCKREAELNTKNKNNLRDSTTEEEPASTYRDRHAG
jgi:hypothetical protein